VFISGDSIPTPSTARTTILKQFELASLRPTLKLLLKRCASRERRARAAGADVRRADRTAVALGCSTARAAPVAGASAAEIASLLAKATAMDGWRRSSCLASSATGLLAVQAARPLRRLGRAAVVLVDDVAGPHRFPLLETQSDGSQVFGGAS
jgi:hypothetical protein